MVILNTPVYVVKTTYGLRVRTRESATEEKICHSRDRVPGTDQGTHGGRVLPQRRGRFFDPWETASFLP